MNKCLLLNFFFWQKWTLSVNHMWVQKIQSWTNLHRSSGENAAQEKCHEFTLEKSRKYSAGKPLQFFKHCGFSSWLQNVFEHQPLNRGVNEGLLKNYSPNYRESGLHLLPYGFSSERGSIFNLPGFVSNFRPSSTRVRIKIQKCAESS